MTKPCCPHYRDEKYVRTGPRTSASNAQMTVGTQRERPSKGVVAQERNNTIRKHRRVSGTARHILSWLSRSQYPAAFGCNDGRRPRFDGTDKKRSGVLLVKNHVKRNRLGRLHQRSLVWHCLAAQRGASYRGWKLGKATIRMNIEFHFLDQSTCNPALCKGKAIFQARGIRG